jgi:hypothetical protein
MFRSTNPVTTPKIRIRWDRIAASVAVGAVLGALGVWAFTIATDEPAPVKTETAVSPVDATESPWATSECQTQLAAALEASQRLTDDVATQWSSGASYGEYVYTDNITPVHDRLDYVLTTYCGE